MWNAIYAGGFNVVFLEGLDDIAAAEHTDALAHGEMVSLSERGVDAGIAEADNASAQAIARGTALARRKLIEHIASVAAEGRLTGSWLSGFPGFNQLAALWDEVNACRAGH